MMFRIFLTSLLMTLSGLTQAQLVILQYHHIDATTPPSTSISPEKFRQHLELLEQEGMIIVDLYDAMQQIRSGATVAEKSVAITFDDAYLSIYENAYPLLKERNWPFTVFVNTSAVDERHGRVMSWDQLREMKASGARIANHSVNHPYLTERPEGISLDTWLNDEIGFAEQRLQAEMGESQKMVAYPYGEFTLAISEWMASHGYLAFGQQSGPVGPMSHPQALPRFPAAGIYANPETLKTKLYTLAMPLSPEQLQEPWLANADMPALTLTFPGIDMHASQIQCFASGEGAIPTEAKAESGVIHLHTQATRPMTSGRSRYNCTAPSISQPGRFYWYSQLWVNMEVSNR